MHSSTPWHDTIRRLGLAGVVSLAVAVGLPAQLGTQVGGESNAGLSSVFAPPWGVTFAKIQAAMETRLGGLAIRQTRRTRTVDPTTGRESYPGTLEFLRFRPANASGGFRFSLEFKGLEGKSLSATGFAKEAAAFDRRAGFRFHYRGFRVSDPVLAAQTYRLVFLAHGRRQVQSGPRPVYRMAVLPKKWDRGSWVLELDAQTGYPLYVGSYTLDERGQSRLESELLVTGFETQMRFPNNTRWWAPNRVITRHATELSALRGALTSTAFVVPTGAVRDYQSASNEVHTDPYKGSKAALLVYTDGLDHIFVRQSNVPVQPRGSDDAVAYWTERGTTTCMFRHHGVQFLLVGRANKRNLRDITTRIYGDAVRILK